MQHWSSETKKLNAFRKLLLVASIGLAASGCAAVRMARMLVPPEVQYDDHDSQTHCNFGVIYEQSGDLKRAKRQYKWALRRDPTNHVALTNLGNIALSEGDWREARELYQSALDIVPAYIPAVNNLAVIFLEKDHSPQDAIALIEPFRDNLPEETRREVLDTLFSAYMAADSLAEADATRREIERIKAQAESSDARQSFPASPALLEGTNSAPDQEGQAAHQID